MGQTSKFHLNFPVHWVGVYWAYRTPLKKKKKEEREGERKERESCPISAPKASQEKRCCKDWLIGFISPKLSVRTW